MPLALKYIRDSLSIASLTRTLNSRLVFTEVNERSSQPCPVRDARKEELRSLIQFIVKALLPNLEDIRNVRHAEEIFHVVQPVRLGIRVCERRVNLGLA
jgi:hypothetical protein